MDFYFCAQSGNSVLMASGEWAKILYLSLLSLLSVSLATTDPGDYVVLEEFRKGLTNAELLKWPSDNQDPCGPPLWPYVFCSGSRVTQIQAKNLGLVGTLPPNFAKLSMLVNIGLQGNNLTGTLPSFKGLSNLQYAFLGGNRFHTIPSDFFTGLDSLQVLSLDKNPLNESTGWMVPSDLESSAQLTNLSLMECNLAGPLPDFLGKMRTLTALKLSYSSLTGEIPASYEGLPLQILWLNNQQQGLSGPLDIIASMTMLNDVWLHGNQFTGRIPSSIGALTSLTRIWLNNNQLVGLIPVNLTALSQLQSLHLDNNALMGPIPKVSFRDFTYSQNSFCQSTPGIPCPAEVGALLDFLDAVDYPPKLARSWLGNDSCAGTWFGISCSSGKTSVINLPNNNLNGTISPSLGKLDSLAQVFLESNNLSGTIPKDLTTLKLLKVLNLSSNNISPPIPQFPSGVSVILDGNKLLVNSSSRASPDSNTPSGSPSSSGGHSSSSSFSRLKFVIIFVPIILGISIILLVVLLLSWRNKGRKNVSSAPSTIVVHPRDSSNPDNFVKVAVVNNASSTTASELRSINNSGSTDVHVIESGNLVISVQVLRVATHSFAPENVLGQGGFGVVYKGELRDGTGIAVKRMESTVLTSKALDEFQAEIVVLSKVRHRNLVSILGYCMEGNEKLLVYEYMPQGDLSKHLFQWKQLELDPLSWKKRLNIALDVARGLEYLHNFANQCFIHRDLKSSNILLCDDYRAKISDFGLAKLAPDGKNSFATRLAGTFGYLAPEYAVTGKVTTKVDVFSFGVVLMELLTGLKALDENRPEESRYLASWFCQMKSNKEKLKSIIDPSLVVTDESFESICIIAELAGHCAAREPHQRPDMGHAVNVLAPLVEKWKPVDDDREEHIGIDLGQPLLQMVKGWQAADGASDVSSMSLDYSKGSIPARPAGFAESFTSADGR
ncbi:receptor protein kinase TMK1 [Canna indica]|uniref:non-specific serine/threonine protein kinase n=1 Tax=Canna indica TaxID=4628 RepID=A0AAQ3JUS5_9LILI|nr:receptor protein kinase TMK1 [Canna indica]